MGWSVNVVALAGVQAQCSERCEWRGTITSQVDVAEQERADHWRLHDAASSIDDDYVSPRHVCPFCLNERTERHTCSPWDGVVRVCVDCHGLGRVRIMGTGGRTRACSVCDGTGRATT